MLRLLRKCSFAVLVLLALAGCRRDVAWFDKRDAGLPLVVRARARQVEGDYDAAIRLFTEAVEQDPSAARAHLDVALIYHDKKKDYVPAIYHYRRYLDLRGESEKREMIENRIRLARQAFAAEVLKPDRWSPERTLKLETENEQLKREVDELKRLVKHGRRGYSADRPTGNEASPSARTYKVKRGDSLSSIAAEMYGDSGRWRQIRDANKDKIRGSQVRVGQLLVIPPLEPGQE